MLGILAKLVNIRPMANMGIKYVFFGQNLEIAGWYFRNNFVVRLLKKFPVDGDFPFRQIL